VIVGLQRIVNDVEKPILQLVVVSTQQETAWSAFLATSRKLTGPDGFHNYLIPKGFVASGGSATSAKPGNSR